VYCELIKVCGYFKKYSTSPEKMHQDFAKDYCHADNNVTCARKLYRKEHGKPPVDEMLPTGLKL
jgi:hypothetical protein